MVLGVIVLGVAGLAVGLGFSELIPANVRNADERYVTSLPRAWLVQVIIWAVVYVVSALVAVTGLFFFRRWSRPLSIFVSTMAIAGWPLLGYNVVSGWSQALFDTALILWGGALAIAYCSPLAERFVSTGRQP